MWTPDGPVPVRLDRGAMATAGVERRSWVRDGVRRHRLVDPVTGAPAGPGTPGLLVAPSGASMPVGGWPAATAA